MFGGLTHNVLELNISEFSDLFGVTADNITEDCQQLIADCDFRYRRLSLSERDEILLKILRQIDSGQLSEAGREKRVVWQNGWTENLHDFLKNGYDLSQLTPKYYRPNQLVRIYADFAKAHSRDIEFNFFRVLRLWLLRRYLEKTEYVYEFGCGPGHNLVAIAELFPDKVLHGLDWVEASRDLISETAKIYNYNITGHLFDMFQPNYNLEIKKNSTIITFGALEQLGTNYESFIQFMIEKTD